MANGYAGMELYTGYFGNFRKYGEITPISVAITNPVWLKNCPVEKKLQPGKWIFEWKDEVEKTVSGGKKTLEQLKKEYVDRYYEESLFFHFKGGKELYEYLTETYGRYKTVVLCCYEKYDLRHPELEDTIPGIDFCHRHIISDFLRKSGVECREKT